ncbi:hypothetical protein MPTK1_6g15180 [Marchantia polymorpha subsp. ruderalis]|uniref:Secreted protein n=2 Tax=Marchantia polymorpha TaxID=3197 RepID=A0AAF6BS86_MARPO|nr:hypothetical protein MARPO_0056s0028 [Marchantia polymorpha]PTQ37552.1 hypothetical protein MARPO_0056s0028 [Marchantia polymorpha]BBN14869.1 hypothetical protein Mp_6g15180 [Marchantia polymorpha subsp. ruderalis]BBN14870.1 hypothetical protein Mp_6g15180 [Marchantia polymorpha subsp. ruderalis]|eukprot:PTQ37551.1 hypothetical protein MARPO_0056s0028 [Marchantia polymorpha]
MVHDILYLASSFFLVLYFPGPKNCSREEPHRTESYIGSKCSTKRDMGNLWKNPGHFEVRVSLSSVVFTTIFWIFWTRKSTTGTTADSSGAGV